MITTVLVYAFVAVTAIQILYYLFFLPFVAHKSVQKTTTDLPISVIVCSKNESKNLQRLIPLLLKQDYPKFQLVLINDASSDDTLDVLEAFAEKDKRIKIVNVENIEAFWGNKKYALTLGIKAATYDHLLFTDADCVPASYHWIANMAACFSEEKSIVLGYGKYRSKKFSWTHLMVRYETLLTAIQYFSYAKLGSPYMAVGRNLAYHRKDFFRVKGFINHIKIRSGDDDLFIRDAATSKNTTISIQPESFTISEPPKNLGEWFRQKRRHISTASHYKFKHKFFLGLFFITKFLLWILAPFAIYFQTDVLTLSTVGSYFFINFLIVGFSASKLKERNLIFFLPFLELFLVLFQITIFIANSISKPNHWK
jgi:glycosyltransferase involved in cell wall biosynthesis